MAPADDTPGTSPALLSQAEAAAACGVSEATIRRARKAGRIQDVQTDPAGGYRIPVASLLAAGFTLDRVTRNSQMSPSGTPQAPPAQDDLREQLEVLRARAEDAERRAAVAEAIAAERARSLDDLRLTVKALTATAHPAPPPEPAPQPVPDDDGADDDADAAAWAELPDRDLAPTSTVLRGPAARAYTDALLSDVVADDPGTAAIFHAARTPTQPVPPEPSTSSRWQRLRRRFTGPSA